MENSTKIFLTLWFFLPSVALAHPGNTASDGCHYCRTNCAKWGEVANARHCHNGGGGGYTAPTVPSCPSNSYRSGSSCVCNSGYAQSLGGSSCVKIPANAHKGNGTTDVWECDSGYVEKGSLCVRPVASSKSSKKAEVIEVEAEQQQNQSIEEDVGIITDEQREEFLNLLSEAVEDNKKNDGSIGDMLLGGLMVAIAAWGYSKRNK